jgi:hypothetical protein
MFSSSSLWSQKSVRGLQVNISTIKPLMILNSFRENVISALGKKFDFFVCFCVFYPMTLSGLWECCPSRKKLPFSWELPNFWCNKY